MRRLVRRYGLAIDNLESVDVVTADGQLRHASDKENTDLLWGVTRRTRVLHSQ
jgi:FAD/FMN-containing dehydrogenase